MDSKDITKYETLEEALTLTIRLANKSYKEVAHSLWPSLSTERAHARLIEALNTSKNQKLTMDEIIHISHFCGRYDALYYMTDECSHNRPTMKSPAEEEKEIIEMLRDMQANVSKSCDLFQKMVKKKEQREKLRDNNIHYMDKKSAFNE